MSSSESLQEVYSTYLRQSASSIADNGGGNIRRLSNCYQRLVASLVLRRTADALVITNRGKKNFALHEQIVVMKERFKQMRCSDTIFDERTLEPAQMAMQRMLAVKLENDISTMQELYKNCSNEIKNTGDYVVLAENIQQFQEEYRSEYDIIRKNIRFKQQIMTCHNQLKDDAEKGEIRRMELSNEISALKAEVDATDVENQFKIILVNKWEAARLGQANLILSQDEKKLEQSILHYSQQKDREQIAMAEIENCINFKIQQLERACDEWQSRYEKETNHFDNQIRDTIKQITDIDSKCTTIRRRGEEYQTRIDAYREHQRQMAEQRKYEDMLCEKATSIQAWWRGVMVRRQLGPYRPKKKGKKGGKSKK